VEATMQSKATTVAAYLDALPPDRREAIEAVRAVINRNLPKGYEEGIGYGMIAWCVPHSLWPAGYHCDPTKPLGYAALASQKGYLSLYLMAVYGSEEVRARFVSAWKKTGKRLDMGKSCIRFTRADDLALDVLADTIASVPVATYLANYAAALARSAKGRGKRSASAKGARTSAAKPSKKQRPKKR
jgi:uncharacterized protein YdhG (YjbR/CyaY superfamily)